MKKSKPNKPSLKAYAVGVDSNSSDGYFCGYVLAETPGQAKSIAYGIDLGCARVQDEFITLYARRTKVLDDKLDSHNSTIDACALRESEKELLISLDLYEENEDGDPRFKYRGFDYEKEFKKKKDKYLKTIKPRYSQKNFGIEL